MNEELKSKDLTLYIISSDKSIHSIEALQHFVNKYWNPNPRVVVLRYKQPTTFKLADNFEVVSMGEDKGHDYVNKNMIEFFNGIDDSHFIFSLDDFLPIRPVNIDMLNTLTEKVVDENISRLALVNQLSNKRKEIIESKDGYDIVEMSQDERYRISTPWSIWSKEYFLKYLYPDGNLWTWEGGMYNDGHRILGTSGQQVIQSCHLFKGMKLKPRWFQDAEGGDLMYEEDRLIMNKFLEKWKNEGVPQLNEGYKSLL